MVGQLPSGQDQLLLLPPSVWEWVEPGDLTHLGFSPPRLMAADGRVVV